MKPRFTTTVAVVTALLSTTALASVATIKNMADKSAVTITGHVESVDNSTEFTLKDTSGTITVDMDKTASIVLKKGDKVTVSGLVDQDITGADINATKISVHESLVNAAADAIESKTPVSFEGASSFDISELPNEGMVKISGVVTDVDSEKEFTLKDGTGSIDVNLDSSAQSASLKEGAEVTVIGHVDASVTGKGINATKIIVKSNS